MAAASSSCASAGPSEPTAPTQAQHVARWIDVTEILTWARLRGSSDCHGEYGHWRTHTETDMYIHTHTKTYLDIHIHTITHTYIHTRTQMQIQTEILTHTQTQADLYTHIHIHMGT